LPIAAMSSMSGICPASDSGVAFIMTITRIKSLLKKLSISDCVERQLLPPSLQRMMVGKNRHAQGITCTRPSAELIGIWHHAGQSRALGLKNDKAFARTDRSGPAVVTFYGRPVRPV
jgi:hypothetical protein